MESGKKDDKKIIFKEKLIERQNEAKVVRKIVAIIALSIFMIAVIVVGGGYLYINSALKPVDSKSKEEIRSGSDWFWNNNDFANTRRSWCH